MYVYIKIKFNRSLLNNVKFLNSKIPKAKARILPSGKKIVPKRKYKNKIV